MKSSDQCESGASQGISWSIGRGLNIFLSKVDTLLTGWWLERGPSGAPMSPLPSGRGRTSLSLFRVISSVQEKDGKNRCTLDYPMKGFNDRLCRGRLSLPLSLFYLHKVQLWRELAWGRAGLFLCSCPRVAVGYPVVVSLLLSSYGVLSACGCAGCPSCNTDPGVHFPCK